MCTYNKEAAISGITKHAPVDMNSIKYCNAFLRGEKWEEERNIKMTHFYLHVLKYKIG